MRIFSILFLCAGLLMQTGYSQQHQYEYQKAYDYAKSLQESGNYYNAIIYYNKANLMEKPDSNDIAQRIAFCADTLNQLRIEAVSARRKAEEAETKARDQKKEIDSLYKVTKSLLARAEEMQLKAETAMLDRAIKDHSNEWKGFAKYSLIDASNDSTEKILNEIDSLDLSENGLLHIPRDVVKCPNLKYLNLFGNPDINWKESGNTLKQLNDNIGIYISVTDLSKIDSSQWHKISGIEILRHDLKYIPANILQQKQLKCLKIENNNLEVLHPDIGSLTNLTELSLFNNKIKELRSEIGKLSNLSRLDLRNNQLTALPPQISKLKKLTDFYLDNNPIFFLPDEIGALTNLTTLSLFNDSLSEVPDGIWKLKNLSYLDLGDNNLTVLPDKIGNLTNLSVLSLYNTGLMILPDEIWNLNKLSELILSRNYITFLSKKIGNLTNLTVLNLRSTGLSELPVEMGKLTKLSELRIEGNYIIKKSNEIGKMTNLTTLYMDIGFLDFNSENILKLKKLTSLYLFGDELNTLPNELIKLTNLNTLYLIGNSLVNFPPVISGLTGLTKLGLNITSMRQIPVEIGKLTQLKHLDLVKTEIDSIPDELFNLNIVANDFNEIGKKLVQVKKYDQALKCFLKCIEKDNTQEYAYGNAGLCYRMLDEPENALRYLDTALSFNENNTWCLRQQMLSYSALKQYDKAYLNAKKLVSIDSAEYSNWYNLSFYSLFVGEITEGIEAAQRSLKLAPDQTGVITNLALGYVLNNQFDKARQLYLEWKSKKFPDDDRFAMELFLKDIQDLEDVNITHPDFIKVRELLEDTPK